MQVSTLSTTALVPDALQLDALVVLLPAARGRQLHAHHAAVRRPGRDRDGEILVAVARQLGLPRVELAAVVAREVDVMDRILEQPALERVVLTDDRTPSTT